MPARPGADAEVKFSAKDSVGAECGARDKPVCFYCKKSGHTINNCFALNKKNKVPKAVNLLKTETPLVQSLSPPIATEQDLDVCAPFLMKGWVSLSVVGPKVPVTILRDSAASQ